MGVVVATRENILVDAREEMSKAGLAGHRYASLFSSPAWIEAITRSYDLTISASASRATNAALLFARISDVRGERVVGMPFSDYCDPLVEDRAVWEDLVEPILAFGLPLTLRVLHNDLPCGDDRFSTTGRALWHAVDLERSEGEIWAGLASSARQNIRKAQRAGVVVRASSALADVHAFHRMHCHIRKLKYRLLAQPITFFENLHAMFASDDRLTVLLAEVDDTPIAGIFFLEWGDTLYYKFNASIDQRLRPNDLLVWEGIRLGLQRRLSRLDFGLSDIEQPGLVRYKRKFATVEAPISLLRWQPPGYFDPRGQEIARTLHRMVELLTEPTVPDDITKVAGEELYRHFC